jgi:hypothetical protein
MHVTCPTHLIHYLITHIIFDEEYRS